MHFCIATKQKKITGWEQCTIVLCKFITHSNATIFHVHTDIQHFFAGVTLIGLHF